MLTPAGGQQRRQEHGESVSHAQITLVSDVKPERVQWLWPGYIPLGKLTMLDGDPGLGKSTLTLDLAARVTRSHPMPDGATSDLKGPVGVVLVTAEDGCADTIRPRLDAAGADVTRVATLDGVLQPGRQSEPRVRLPTVSDLEAIEEVVDLLDARLLVVDPLMAFLGAGKEVDSYRDQDVRSALTPLLKLVDSKGVALVCVRHLTKAQGGKAIYRGGGSIGILGAARAGLVVAKDPNDGAGTRRILAPTKSNLATAPTSLAYHMESVDDAVRIVWEGVCHHTADDLMSPPMGEERSARDDAMEFLRAVLNDGPILAKNLQARARREGHAIRTLRRAADALGVEKKKIGFEGGGWEWSFASTPLENHQAGPFDPDTSPKAANDTGYLEAAAAQEADGPFHGAATENGATPNVHEGATAPVDDDPLDELLSMQGAWPTRSPEGATRNTPTHLHEDEEDERAFREAILRAEANDEFDHLFAKGGS